MSFTVEARVLSDSAKITAELLKEWAELRQTKKAEELNTPEWKKLESAYVQHLLWRFQYPKRVFGQQILANWIITLVVLALVVCGIVFSFIQLNYALTVGDFSSLTTEVEVNAAGRVAISSSVIGAVMLVVSLAFFALYLKYVFQIKHTHPPHISLSDTDAKAILEKAKSEGLSEGSVPDVEITGIRPG
ncbi:hypothetical protein PRZ61_07190 [Halomonas pacifica]|uniref:hypothetical protein n=1 Tax=Bisbaumannia pacifica TaxID=77098 RepID=UPI002359C048|nr:hypothetical protein [Halomonas pacifica]MDC8803227.1 hypothetical protein [Halomonas pacifica]